MENYLDDLIAQAKLDIERAQKRLETLTLMRRQMSVADNTVSVKEASELIGICDKSVIAWIGSGRLKGHRVGKSYRIDRDSIKEALAGN